jgi:hypothetical protein
VCVREREKRQFGLGGKIGIGVVRGVNDRSFDRFIVSFRAKRNGMVKK